MCSRPLPRWSSHFQHSETSPMTTEGGPQLNHTWPWESFPPSEVHHRDPGSQAGNIHPVAHAFRRMAHRSLEFCLPEPALSWRWQWGLIQNLPAILRQLSFPLPIRTRLVQWLVVLQVFAVLSTHLHTSATYTS